MLEVFIGKCRDDERVESVRAKARNKTPVIDCVAAGGAISGVVSDVENHAVGAGCDNGGALAQPERKNHDTNNRRVRASARILVYFLPTALRHLP